MIFEPQHSLRSARLPIHRPVFDSGTDTLLLSIRSAKGCVLILSRPPLHRVLSAERLRPDVRVARQRRLSVTFDDGVGAEPFGGPQPAGTGSRGSAQTS